MTSGPKNKEELRALLTSRQFPNDAQSQRLQTPSDRMREKALEFGSTLMGLVPDSEFQQLAGLVLKDLVVKGEMTLCELHDVKTEHEPLRVLRERTGSFRPFTEAEAEAEAERPKTVIMAQEDVLAMAARKKAAKTK